MSQLSVHIWYYILYLFLTMAHTISAFIIFFNIHISVVDHIYIYIYIVLFCSVKPELGVIPSGQENHSKAEHLNFPGRELNVINITEQYIL